MSENYISKQGLENLKKELEKLTTIKRPEVISRIASARELGDLSENAEYHEAREEQGFIEGRIREIESLLKNAVVVENNGDKNIIGLGSKVVATCGGNELEYTIVGHGEADPMAGKISHESPLGQAFIGKKIGEEIEINVPAGTMKCKVNKIA